MEPSPAETGTMGATARWGAASSAATTAAIPVGAQPAIPRQVSGVCVVWESGEVGAHGSVEPGVIGPSWAIPVEASAAAVRAGWWSAAHDGPIPKAAYCTVIRVRAPETSLRHIMVAR